MKSRIVLESAEEVLRCFEKHAEQEGTTVKRNQPPYLQHGSIKFEDGLLKEVGGHSQQIVIEPPVTAEQLFAAMARKLNIKILKADRIIIDDPERVTA